MNSGFFGGFKSGFVTAATRLLLVGCLAPAFCACVASTDAGDEGVWPSSATQMVLKDSGGGFVVHGPQGSTCPEQGEGSYTLTTTDRKLAWHVCQPGTSGPLFAYVDGQRTLTPDQMNGVIAALQKVTPSTNTSCGADKQTLGLEVTASDGQHAYLDSFYACAHAGTYVDGLDEVMNQVISLAK